MTEPWCNAEHTRFAAGEHDVQTVAQLRERIAHLPGDTPVVMDAFMIDDYWENHHCHISVEVHRRSAGGLLVLVGGGCLAFPELESDLDRKPCAFEGNDDE